MRMFLFEEFHMYGVLGVAVGTSFVATFIMQKLKVKSVLTNEFLMAKREKPGREHIIGGLMAGFGWALTGACPGPALAQMGFGTMSGIFTFSGILLGVYVYGFMQKDSSSELVGAEA